MTIKTDIKRLPPACFGMVMATGIISLAAHVLDFERIATGLLYINFVMYAVLWIATLARLWLYRSELLSDMVDHVRAPGFFTLPAGSSVLGSQCLVLLDSMTAGITLWLIATVLWLALTYTIFTAFTIKREKPSLDRGMTGGWLLAVVATQSIVVLSALIADHLSQPYSLGLHFLALSMWLWGGMLYIWIITLILYRYTFFPISPADLAPPWFINMGAMAISTLAGARLIISVGNAPFIDSLLPFLKGFTIFFWAAGTWWIPLLLALGVWRHVCKRFPLTYDPLYWAAVFPLGMYAVGTHQMAAALDLHFLDAVPVGFFYLAMAAWIATFLGLLRSLLTRKHQAISE